MNIEPPQSVQLDYAPAPPRRRRWIGLLVIALMGVSFHDSPTSPPTAPQAPPE